MAGTKNIARRVGAALAGLQSLMIAGLAWAQAQNPDVDVTLKTERTTSTLWYNEWWVWAVGIAVFLILIVALTNRGGSRA